jgi:excisionase family DNA binding protein
MRTLIHQDDLGDLRCVSRDEAAKLLNLHINSVGRLIARGQLPASRAGRKVLIRVSDLRKFLERNASGDAKDGDHGDAQ